MCDSLNENTGKIVQSRNSGELLSERDVIKVFDQALRFERHGEWQEAISLYDQIAQRLPGQQDGEYAKGCACRLRERLREYQEDLSADSRAAAVAHETVGRSRLGNRDSEGIPGNKRQEAEEYDPVTKFASYHLGMPFVTVGSVMSAGCCVALFSWAIGAEDFCQGNWENVLLACAGVFIGTKVLIRLGCWIAQFSSAFWNFLTVSAYLCCVCTLALGASYAKTGLRAFVLIAVIILLILLDMGRWKYVAKCLYRFYSQS